MTLNGACPADAWIIIPARGGSVGIPRKNVRVLGGKPLIAHVVGTALQVLPAERVIVVTDDGEISDIAAQAGANVLLETAPTPPNETLDTKIIRNLPALRSRGAKGQDIVITVQPTSPLLRASTLRRSIKMFNGKGVGSVLSVVDDRHLRWRLDGSGNPVPSFLDRVNRQQLPEEFRETGGIIAARLSDIEAHGTRIVMPVNILPLEPDEAVDIDNYSDLYAAAHLLSRKKIAIRVDASKQIGMGHVYRMLAFASELARHDLRIFLNKDMPLGQAFFSKHPYRTETIDNHADFCRKLEDLGLS